MCSAFTEELDLLVLYNLNQMWHGNLKEILLCHKKVMVCKGMEIHTCA